MWKNVIVILIFAKLLSAAAIDDECSEGESCVFIKECSTRRHGDRGLRNIKCSSHEPKICCPREGIKNNTEPNNLLPDWNTCGIQFVDLWIEGRTNIDEHSWIALLRYEKPNGHGFYCEGVLISSRYVLTAAHCVDSLDLPRTWRLSHVRLGEWNTRSESDCELDYCSPAVLDVPIEETIVHKDYNISDSNVKHDIAIIRLTEEVAFTEFIKPICLPINLKQHSLENMNFELAGWGTMNVSEMKQKARVQFVKYVDCKNVYKHIGRKITKNHICATGGVKQGSCQGDTGGILMSKATNVGNWMAVGVRSYGPSPCESLGWPTVYTRVSKYLDWIQSKMRL